MTPDTLENAPEGSRELSDEFLCEIARDYQVLFQSIKEGGKIKWWARLLAPRKRLKYPKGFAGDGDTPGEALREAILRARNE